MSDTEPQVKREPVVDASSNGHAEVISQELLDWLTPDRVPATRELPQAHLRPEYEAALTTIRRPFNGVGWDADLAKLPDDMRTYLSKDLQLRAARLMFGLVPVFRVLPYFEQAKADQVKEAQARFAALQAEAMSEGRHLGEHVLKQLRAESGLDKAEAELDATQRLPHLFRAMFNKEAKGYHAKVETLATDGLVRDHRQLDRLTEQVIADLSVVMRKHAPTFDTIAKEAHFWESQKPKHPLAVEPFPWPAPGSTIASLLHWCATKLRFRFPQS